MCRLLWARNHSQAPEKKARQPHLEFCLPGVRELPYWVKVPAAQELVAKFAALASTPEARNGHECIQCWDNTRAETDESWGLTGQLA